jgi:hypothetical protein
MKHCGRPVAIHKAKSNGVKILAYDFVSETPLDIMNWCKFEANENHDGASLGPLEMYDEVTPALVDWESHCNDRPEGQKIQASTCPTRGDLRYEKQKETHILSKRGHFFGPWETFCDSAIFVTFMDLRADSGSVRRLVDPGWTSSSPPSLLACVTFPSGGGTRVQNPKTNTLTNS